MTEFEWLTECKNAYDNSYNKYKQLLKVPFTFKVLNANDFEYEVTYNVNNDNLTITIIYIDGACMTRITIHNNAYDETPIDNYSVDGNHIEQNLKLIDILIDNYTY